MFNNRNRQCTPPWNLRRKRTKWKFIWMICAPPLVNELHRCHEKENNQKSIFKSMKTYCVCKSSPKYRLSLDLSNRIKFIHIIGGAWELWCKLYSTDRIPYSLKWNLSMDHAYTANIAAHIRIMNETTIVLFLQLNRLQVGRSMNWLPKMTWIEMIWWWSTSSS